MKLRKGKERKIKKNEKQVAINEIEEKNENKEKGICAGLRK